MILVAAVDDAGGMMFHNRRQSQDRILRQKLREIAAGRILWMNAYTCKLFSSDNDDSVRIMRAEDFLQRASAGDFCFVENLPAAPYMKRIERIILFHWNRRYPGDTWFDIDLSGWKLIDQDEFAGSSHPRITMEIWEP